MKLLNPICRFRTLLPCKYYSSITLIDFNAVTQKSKILLDIIKNNNKLIKRL